jgi:hypothetical protein
MFDQFFKNAAIGWVGRRAVEVGGLVTLLVNLYNSLPPAHQETIVEVLTGKGGGLTVGAVFGLALWLWSQFMSFRATTKDQMVADGKKVDSKKDLPKNKQVLVEEMVNVAVEKKKAERKPGLLDKLFGK